MITAETARIRRAAPNGSMYLSRRLVRDPQAFVRRSIWRGRENQGAPQLTARLSDHRISMTSGGRLGGSAFAPGRCPNRCAQTLQGLPERSHPFRARRQPMELGNMGGTTALDRDDRQGRRWLGDQDSIGSGRTRRICDELDHWGRPFSRARTRKSYSPVGQTRITASTARHLPAAADGPCRLPHGTASPQELPSSTSIFALD